MGYHRVASDPVDPWQLCVSPQHFTQHLEVLADIADIVPLQQLKDRLAIGTAATAAAITFDDGYADNLHTALPILERFGTPATVFVCTAATGRGSFWWDRLASILLGDEDIAAGLAVEEIGFRWQGGISRNDRETLHLELWRRLQRIEDGRREAILDRLAQRAGRPLKHDGRPMTADEVRTLASSPLIEIGAHSSTHAPLAALSENEQLEEIELSARDCEKMTGIRPASFAYPFGATAPATARLTRRAGFARACSQRADLVWRDTDPFELPRIGALDQDAAGFARRLHREWLL